MQKTIVLSLALLVLVGASVYLYNSRPASNFSPAPKTVTPLPAETIVREDPLPQPKHATIDDYVHCKATGCKVRSCVDGRPNAKACRIAVYDYAMCLSTNEDCLQWDYEYATLSADARLPDSYYQCHFNCRPLDLDLTGDFQLIYACEDQCSGSVQVTYNNYQPCLNKCPDKCGEDGACNAAYTEYSFCESYTTECLNWPTEIAAYDPLPASFYTCDKYCRPERSASSKFYDSIYACKMRCAGLEILL